MNIRVNQWIKNKKDFSQRISPINQISQLGSEQNKFDNFEFTSQVKTEKTPFDFVSKKQKNPMPFSLNPQTSKRKIGFNNFQEAYKHPLWEVQVKGGYFNDVF